MMIGWPNLWLEIIYLQLSPGQPLYVVGNKRVLSFILTNKNHEKISFFCVTTDGSLTQVLYVFDYRQYFTLLSEYLKLKLKKDKCWNIHLFNFTFLEDKFSIHRGNLGKYVFFSESLGKFFELKFLLASIFWKRIL